MEKARTDSSFSASRVLNQGVEAITGNPAQVLGFTFALAVLPAIVVNIAVTAIAPTLMPNMLMPFTVASIVISILSLLLSIAGQGGLLYYFFANARGERIGAGGMALAGLRLLFPLLLLSILAWIAIFIGFGLFFAPGVFLATIWAATPGVVVAEREGVFHSFGRSRALTKGARWKVLGLELVIMIVVWMASAAVSLGAVGTFGVQAMATPGLSVGMVATMLLSGAVSTVGQAWWAMTQAALYQELVEWKEGPDTDDLAEIFA